MTESNLYVDAKDSWTPEDGLTFDQVQLLIKVLKSEIQGLESCSIFENDDLKHEAMLNEAADLKAIVAFFENLIAD